MSKRSNRQLALDWMEGAGADREAGKLEASRDGVQEAQVYALLAVADELAKLREAMSGVKDALEDQDSFGVGTHLRHVSEYLEKIAKR